MEKDETTAESLYDTSKSITGRMLEDYTYPWEVLPHIDEIIQKLEEMLSEKDYKRVGKSIWIHKSAEIPPIVCVKAPTIICEGVELHTGCLIRGNMTTGFEAVVDDSTELKNAILFDGVQVPHCNYAGNSILSYKLHMGASALAPSMKSNKTLVEVHAEGGDIETGLERFGAILGDLVEVGYGSVLNPRTVTGARSSIYPLSSVRGYVDGDYIYKGEGEIMGRY